MGRAKKWLLMSLQPWNWTTQCPIVLGEWLGPPGPPGSGLPDVSRRRPRLPLSLMPQWAWAGTPWHSLRRESSRWRRRRPQQKFQSRGPVVTRTPSTEELSFQGVILRWHLQTARLSGPTGRDDTGPSGFWSGLEPRPGRFNSRWRWQGQWWTWGGARPRGDEMWL